MLRSLCKPTGCLALHALPMTRAARATSQRANRILGAAHNIRGATRLMAQSKYEYVKKYEQDDTLLLGCYIVIRLDGKGFTKCAAAFTHAKC
jgi:hypothetical protein